MAKKSAKKKAEKKAGSFDALKKKVRAKKASKKKAGKKKAAKGIKSTTPASSREVERAALEADVRQWTRYWMECGWDALEATAKMHPELKPKEIQRIATQYRASPHVDNSLLQVLRETTDRLEITPDEAAGVLSDQAMTSVLDFWGEDGDLLPIKEMKRLPRGRQLALKKLKVTEQEHYDNKGRLSGKTRKTEVEAYDIQKAIEQLARLRQWGFSEGERDLAELLKKAERRLQESEPIDITDYEVQED